MTWSRRQMLSALGASALLPLITRRARADVDDIRRLVVFVVPNGMPDALWTPDGEGATWQSTGILDALAPVRSDVAVLTGLANVPSYAREHALSLPTVLYGGRPDLVGGASLDQQIAAAYADRTLYPSLQLASERDTPCLAGGVGCNRRQAVSWAAPDRPTPLEVSPVSVFRRLQAPTTATSGATAFARQRLSALEAGAARDAWEAGLDAIDRRLAWPRAASCGGDEPPPTDRGLLYGDDRHIEDMMASIVLALSCDLTRVVTYMLGFAGSNRPLSALGVPLGHHELSHTTFEEGHLRFGQWAVGHWAALVGALADTPDPAGGRLLDRTDVVFVSDMGDGTTHDARRLPVLIAGAGAGAWRGQHRVADPDRPLADLWLGLAQAHGLPITTFGEDGQRAWIGG
jgi:hypothetical protein